MGFKSHAGRFLLTGSQTLPDDIFDIIGKGLPIKNGGTGATTASSAFYNIVSALSTVSSAGSSYYIPMQYSTSGRRISYSTFESSVRSSVISSIDIADLGGCRFQSGTYTGTGKSGDNNPNSITVSFIPKLMGVAPINYGYDYNNNLLETYTTACAIDDVSLWTSSYTQRRGFGNEISALFGKRSGKTVYWYVNSTSLDGPEYQFNILNTTYKWFAIG